MPSGKLLEGREREGREPPNCSGERVGCMEGKQPGACGQPQAVRVSAWLATWTRHGWRSSRRTESFASSLLNFLPELHLWHGSEGSSCVSGARPLGKCHCKLWSQGLKEKAEHRTWEIKKTVKLTLTCRPPSSLLLLPLFFTPSP